ELPADLKDGWDERERLARLDPAAFAPDLWARYLATSLRYEQLVRAQFTGLDDLKTAPALRDRLRGLADQVEKARHLGLTSAGGTLALPAALGGALAPDDDARLTRALEDLWKKEAAPEEEYRKFLEAPAGTRDPAAASRLRRVRAASWLLD